MIDAATAASAFRRRRGHPARRAKGRTATSSLSYLGHAGAPPLAVGLAPIGASAYLRGVPSETPQSSDNSVPHYAEPRRPEPIFNVPWIVIATVTVLVLVHLLRTYVLTDEQDVEFLLTFAFIPARYGTDLGTSGAFPGGFGADLWTFFSYAFIHANLMHLGFNLAWLVPFGTALARRFGAWRYTLFMLIAAAAGALAHLVSNLGAMDPMIGASAAISGAMAAAMRFVFQEKGPLGVFRHAADGGYRVPAAPLLQTLRDPRILLFAGVWLGLNLLFGLGTISFGQEPGQLTAWQAHIGGFFAGLLLFDAFDPVVRQPEFGTAAND